MMITILTPTYNRAHTLPRLYASLVNQMDKDFEWVIIDDGSSDSTCDLIKKYISENRIKIKYYNQKNQGKHVAINYGAELATGEWVFIVDSDDAVTEDGVEKIKEKINLHYSERLVGVCFRRSDFSGKILGKKFLKSEALYLNATKAGRLFEGDLAYIFKREVLKDNKFPVFKDEKFVPELYIWNKISDVGDIVYFNCDSIYLCEYMDDGYTRGHKSNMKRNPLGFLVFYSTQIKKEDDLFLKIKNLIRSLQCIIYLVKK